MDDDSRIRLGIVLCVACVLAAAFLSACEQSITELPDSDLDRLAEESRRGRRLKRMTDSANRFLMSGLVLRACTAMLTAAAGARFFYPPLKKALGSLPKPVPALGAAAIVTAVLLTVFAALGLVLPKRLCTAGKLGEGFAMAISGIYSGLLALASPIVVCVSGLSSALSAVFGVKCSDLDQTVTEEEILMMVDAVNETGGIEEAQAEMISNIFEFDDLEVHEIMTHRTEVEAVPADSTLREAAQIVIDTGFSRLPVYEGSIDSICGVVFAKDLLEAAIGGEQNAPVRSIMREIRYVPETKSCDELMQEFTSQKTQIAVVVDDYGGTAGIVTLEDLLEEIVGSIQDEYDNEVPDIQEITPNTFDIAGRADPADVMEALGCTLPEDCQFDTISGFVTDLLGHIPAEGERESVKWQNVSFTVIKTEDKMIEKLRAVIDRTQEQGKEQT